MAKIFQEANFSISEKAGLKRREKYRQGSGRIPERLEET